MEFRKSDRLNLEIAKGSWTYFQEVINLKITRKITKQISRESVQLFLCSRCLLKCFAVFGVVSDVKVGDEVFLKNISNSETIARGMVNSLYPNQKVGSTEIGCDWCELNIQVAVKRDENLVRPIQTTIGASIALSFRWFVKSEKDA
ncbi:hypothetical protein SSX86_007551 [Deinandra increscens subsp. villosa]|uniref:Transposase Tnp1/En/Spm-like domain-containing protein n=1 Tax=Deinandra increscens subsp. villosa TaxID=3103831 RepID=A0AAP0H675_9ASTR